MKNCFETMPYFPESVYTVSSSLIIFMNMDVSIHIVWKTKNKQQQQ